MKRNRRTLNSPATSYRTALSRNVGLQTEAPSAATGGQTVIKDVVLVQMGEAKGHDQFLDKAFIQGVVELGTHRGTIPCQFGHASLCTPSFGQTMGFFRNFRLSGDDTTGYRAIADLFMLNSARLNPNGNLTDYMVAFAKEAPDMFGMSIVFSSTNGHFYNDRGEKVPAEIVSFGEYDTEKWGKVDTTKYYPEIQELHGADAVDNPAATTGLFAQVFAAFGNIREFATIRKALTAMTLFNIDTTTDDGRAIRVITESDKPSVGDAAVQVGADGSETDLPDGEYVIPDMAITIETAMGAIVSIEAVEPTPAPIDTPVMAAAASEAETQLAAANSSLRNALSEIEKLKTVLAAKEKRIEQLSKQAGFIAANTTPDADGVPPVETVKKFSAETYAKIKK